MFARNQVTSQRILIDRISLPQVSTRMNYVHTAPLPQTEADFFDEKGLLKEYRPPVQQQQQQQYQQMGGTFVLRKIPIIPSSVSDPAPDPVPTPDFPFQEFPLMEVV